MLGRVIMLWLVAVTIGATAAAQDVKLPEIDFGRYRALVIGNNDYQHLRNLTTAVRDAEAVATLLEKKYGFQVTKLTNATRRDIAGALNRLRQTLTERDNLLIYYAGHGVLDEEAGAGYWQPVDARSDDDTDWFSNARLTNYLKAISAQHVMVVADSCYSGNLARVATSTVRSGAERTAWMQRMNQKRSRTALTSGGLEPVLDRGGGAHSVFARAFLTALDESPGVLFGEELFDRVKGVVLANAEQTPEYSDIRHTGHEKGDFLFVPLDINVSVTVKIPPREQADREALFWETIKNSDDPAMFEAYLEQYPEGEFARIAKLKFEAVTKAKEQQTALVVPPKPEIEIDPIEAEYVAVKNANVRAKPTVRSAQVTTLKRGASVHVAGKVKGRNWYLVERNDKALGYVYGNLLQEPEARPPDGRGLETDEAHFSELVKRAETAERALEDERALARELRRKVKQLNRLRVALSEMVEASEAKTRAREAAVADLDRRLHQALANRVQELAKFRSEFFGRLRQVLGERPDIQIVGDRFVFQSEVLFRTGEATLKAAGQQQLIRFAATLKENAATIPSEIDWVLRVDGHTDRRPIRTPRFPSNWELSTARAISVVKFLIDQGIAPSRLVGAGFGRFHPLDPREDQIASRRNRRIEFKLTKR